MKHKSKIPAMTLNEMLVVIILSSIVLGIAFSVLSMVQKHIWSIQENITFNTELTLFEQTLWIDFNRYNSANYNALKNEIVLNSEKDSVTYTFKKEYTLRGKDTLNFSVKHKTIFFNGDSVNKGKIDAIKIELDSTQQSKSLFIYRHNDAAQFIN